MKKLIKILQLRYLLVTLSGFLFLNTSHAQSILAGQQDGILYYDIIPDTSIVGLHNTFSGIYEVDVNKDGVIDFVLSACDCSGLGGGTPNVSITPKNNNEIAVSHYDSCFCGPLRIFVAASKMAQSYNVNDAIDELSNWQNTPVYLNYYKHGLLGPTPGCYFNCSGATFSGLNSLYIGVRIFLSPGKEPVYGWIKVKGVTQTSVTIEEFACSLVQYYEYKIYPNPVERELVVEYPSGLKECVLSIYSILGQKIKQYSSESGQFKIDINDLDSGIYFIKLESEKMVVVRKIMKKKFQ